MEELKKCDLHCCGNEEFLVWRCEGCEKLFCEQHRHKSEHNCISLSSYESSSGTTLHVFNKDRSQASSCATSHIQDMFDAIETRHECSEDFSAKIHANVKSSTVLKVRLYMHLDLDLDLDLAHLFNCFRTRGWRPLWGRSDKWTL